MKFAAIKNFDEQVWKFKELLEKFLAVLVDTDDQIRFAERRCENSNLLKIHGTD